MKKYTTDWKGISITFALLVGLWIFFAYFEAMKGTLLVGSLFVAIPIGIGVLLATVFSYATIEGEMLRYMYFFYLRRTIDINSITDINDQPTYKAAKGQFRSLYIFYKDKKGDNKWIEFRITIFPEKTLGMLIKDLKEINPHIELNKYAEKLMQTAS
jgi:hypothetical protein